MRQRRGLSPRTERAVARLTDQDIEDLRQALPFLAPVLPVPAGGGVGTGRTPRKVSKTRITPRGSTVALILSSRRESERERRESEALLLTPSGGGGGGAGGAKLPPVEHRLSLFEMELATKAWLQILAAHNNGDSSGAGGSHGGSGGSSSHSGKVGAALTPAALFAKVCTTVPSLHTGRQIKDILQLLHIPVLPLIADLLDHVVALLGSPCVQPSSNAMSSPGATGTAPATSSSSSLHFFKFLQFLASCKYLDAIRKHRANMRRSQLRPVSSHGNWGHLEDIGGLDATFGGDPTDPDDPAAASGASAHIQAQSLDAVTQDLEREDFEALFDYVAAMEEKATLASQEQRGAATTLSSPEEEGLCDDSRFPQRRQVTAKALETFAQSFYLSLSAVLPSEYLVEQDGGAPSPGSPAGLGASGSANSSRAHPYDPSFSSTSASPAPMLRASSNLRDRASLVASPQPTFSSPGGSVGPGGAQSHPTGPSSPSPATQKPPVQFALHPTAALQPVTLDEFAQHIESLESGTTDGRAVSRGGGTRLAFDSQSGGGGPGPRDLDGDASPAPQTLAAAGSMRPLKLSGGTGPLSAAGTGDGPSPVASSAAMNRRKSGPSPARTDRAGAETSNGAANNSASDPLQLQLATLMPHATFMERHNAMSTLQLPPLTYKAYVESKVKKHQDEVERRRREHDLREEYLYGPPRPKPKPLSAEEESLNLLTQITDLVERTPDDVFDVTDLTKKLHVMHRLRLIEEWKEANRYAFMMPGGPQGSIQEFYTKPLVMSEPVRRSAAQELLGMLDRCPDNSVLGSQQTAKQASHAKGMNGIVSSLHGEKRQKKHVKNASR